jgi:hypothetical protein
MSIALLALVIFVYSAGAQDNSVLTYHGDAGRSGNFVVPALTWEKARSVKLDRAFDAHVAGHLYAQPLYWHASGSNTAMLSVVTEDDIVQALDATTGKELWRRSVGTPVKRIDASALKQNAPRFSSRRRLERSQRLGCKLLALANEVIE